MLISLLSGMRLEEACQMECADIIVVDGISCIDINESGDKKLKTPASKRLIPVHSILLDHFDFLGFVDRQRRTSVRLFPALKSINGSFGHAIHGGLLIIGKNVALLRLVRHFIPFDILLRLFGSRKKSQNIWLQRFLVIL